METRTRPAPSRPLGVLEGFCLRWAIPVAFTVPEPEPEALPLTDHAECPCCRRFAVMPLTEGEA
jgi:hypothetical protein